MALIAEPSGTAETPQECRGLGFSPDDLSIVRLNREDLRHIKAIGISGKRSVMMACLVALYRDEGSKESDLFGTPWEGHGVTVNVICDRIPVVDLAQHSIFHGNASWLLQAATGTIHLRKSRPEVKAVGTNGKRSVMLALCLVLAHNDEAAAAMLEADIEDREFNQEE
eukprot:g20873.t1